MSANSIHPLMVPRYEVIADYPGSRFKVGQIEVLKHVNIEGTPYASFGQSEYDKYPHLFRKLEWWEHLEESEMPKYIRLNEKMVVMVAKHHCIRHGEFQAHDTKYNYPYNVCTPATEAEYINQNKIA